METGAIRKRTRRLRAANPLIRVGSHTRGWARGLAWPAPAASPARRSAILRKHAEPPPRASYQR
jgi:hypothetical protein